MRVDKKLRQTARAKVQRLVAIHKKSASDRVIQEQDIIIIYNSSSGCRHVAEDQPWCEVLFSVSLYQKYTYHSVKHI